MSALDIINRQNIIFVGAAVYPVGCEDRTKYLTSEHYNENLLSENSGKTLSSEDREEEELICPWVADTRLSKNTSSRAHPLRHQQQRRGVD